MKQRSPAAFLLSLGLLLAGIFCLSRADAFYQSRETNYNHVIPSGGGISWTPTFAVANSAGFGSTINATGLTLGTGDILVFLYLDIAGLGPFTPTVTVAGVTASLVGTVTDSTDTQINVFFAAGVAPGTGTIAVSGGTMNDYALAGGLLTGENHTSGVVTGVNNLTRGDPRQATGSVPSGGIGIAFIAAAGNTTSPLPTTWTAGATGTWTGSSTMEAYTSGDAACSGASTTSAGSVTASATGSVGQAWSFGNGGIAMVAFGT